MKQSASPSISLPDAIVIDKLVRSRRRTIGLQISSDACLIVRAPRWARHGDIKQAVVKHREWIIKTRARVLYQLAESPPRRFEDGEQFLFLGQKYPLRICDGQPAPLHFDGVAFCLPGSVLSPSKIFHDWYRAQAEILIAKRVEFWADLYGLKYARLRINGAQHRWGSCSQRGNLNFSWRLILAPITSVDYVVVHELAHLEIKNHSLRFWKKVESMLPEYKTAKRWLKENERALRL